MPYIKSGDGRREKLQNGDTALNAAELNYQIFYYIKHNNTATITVLYGTIKTFVDNFLGETPNYQKYNDMTGCLIRCAKEVKRRLGILSYVLYDLMDNYDQEIEIYEDKKIVENGDVG